MDIKICDRCNDRIPWGEKLYIVRYGVQNQTGSMGWSHEKELELCGSCTGTFKNFLQYVRAVVAKGC